MASLSRLRRSIRYKKYQKNLASFILLQFLNLFSHANVLWEKVNWDMTFNYIKCLRISFDLTISCIYFGWYLLTYWCVNTIKFRNLPGITVSLAVISFVATKVKFIHCLLQTCKLFSHSALGPVLLFFWNYIDPL